ncbi:hypothetical protein Glove_91g45 [Diversispora epigaea]|uniref:Protein kinase domain-containing protein n=1 Tax=Diversispora epigaea TaxID=1348612 RepID=A0A397J7Z0_9GLOM|nr:hypothetical protein Glove_91g45 [Diversispora epigaea]
MKQGKSYGECIIGVLYLFGTGVTKDEEKAFQWFLKSSEGGNHFGQYSLGTCYYEGIGITKDEEKAFQWSLKSAEGGNSHGQCLLGDCYQLGIGTLKDEEKAFRWFLKSAEGENNNGQYKLGMCYQFGIGTIKDDEKAFLWYLKSAEGGNSDGQNLLGDCYQHEIGTAIDEEKAFQWYLKSAEEGNSIGQYNLAEFYYYGTGILKDEEKAFHWYMKSAEGGNSDGHYNLGCCYLNGIGTIKDEEKAFHWYMKSAEWGNSDGQYSLGYCYENGIGTTKDEEKAFHWYMKSAEEGGNDGQYSLAYCYEKGIGTTKDEEKAFQWYLKSAEGGNSSGQYDLGNCYYRGVGTTKDEEKAFHWYVKSAEEGNKNAQKLIEIFYRNEIRIPIIKKYQNKDTNKEDSNLAIIKSSTSNLNSIENLANNNFDCCICWQTNGCNEICKKYFQNFGRCHDCGNLYIRKNICKNCKHIELNYILKYPSSFGDLVDVMIQATHLDENAKEWEIWRWIDYSKFENIEYLSEGGFGSVWKAEWVDMPEEIFEFYNTNQVALKKLRNLQEINYEFFAEIIVNFYCRNKYVLPIFAVTQEPTTKEYAIILRYMKHGNLRNFLQQNKALPWIERLWLLHSFISGLEVIHNKGFIHHDLHPGNLMITEAHKNARFIRLGDLGLCRPANESSSLGAFGVLPYIAPERFDKNQCTQASDIYSVGIIMWVISTGKIPFANRAYDSELLFHILNGQRPEINKNTPQCYVELMKKCWHKEPSKRPNTEMIFNLLDEWIRNLNGNIKTKNSQMFLNADQEKYKEDFNSFPNETIHPEVTLISKPLPQIRYSNFDLDNIDWNDC